MPSVFGGTCPKRQLTDVGINPPFKCQQDEPGAPNNDSLVRSRVLESEKAPGHEATTRPVWPTTAEIGLRKRMAI
jgi:hypothetical protein